MSESVEKIDVLTKKPIDFNCKINESDFKLSISDGAPINDIISACLAYLEHFKNLYMQNIEKNKDAILQPIKQAPTDTVQAELVEPPTSA